MAISEYFNFDLHIHTNKSNITKKSDYEGVFDEDKLLEKLRDKHVDAYSLTDHNIFNIEAYENLFTKTPTNMKLFIGVELDLIKQEDLLQNIKESVEIDKTGDGSKTKDFFHSLIIFKSDNVRELNRKLLNMYTKVANDYNNKFGESIDLVSESSNGDIKFRVTSLELLFRFFSDEDYLIISHGTKSPSIIGTYKGELPTAQKMILLGFINSLEMSPNKVDAIEHYNIGFDAILADDYKNREDVPYVIFSDNHEIDAYPNYKSTQIIEGRPMTWIKGSLSFETLRMAFVDPTSRIKLQTSRPLKPAKYLEEISFDLCEGEIEKTVTISLSSGINTIIGGRSSGKSLLFNAIIHNINTVQNKSEIRNYSSGENKIINMDSIQGKMNFERESKSENICNAIAYTQDNIVKLFEGKGRDLSDELPFTKLSTQDIQPKLNEVYLLLDDVAEKYSNYFHKSLNKKLLILTDDFINMTKKREFSYLYEDGISSIKNSVISDSSIIHEIYESVVKLHDDLEAIKSNQLNNIPLFNETEINTINEVIQIFNGKILDLSSLYKKVLLKETFLTELEKNVNKLIKNINTQEDLIISTANGRFTGGITQAKEYFKGKLELKKSCRTLNNLNLKFEPKANKISDQYVLVTEVDCKFNISLLLDRLDEKIMNFNKSNLFQSLENMIYSNGDVRIRRSNNQPDSFTSLINKIKVDLNTQIIPKYSIVEKGNRKDLNSDFMSPGKKASTFLEIKLEIGKSDSDSKIYLIDQPEDNLDNEFITDVLIDKMRELRNNSQIILVSHNAAIAINSDSENIIISKNENGKITYNNDGIENTDFRKQVCKLLDGGYYVFDRRYHKYDIPFRKIYEPINKEVGDDE